MQENSKFIKGQMGSKNEEIRSEFFKHGAIEGDGAENEEYYKLREEFEKLEGDAKLEHEFNIIRSMVKRGVINREQLQNLWMTDTKPKEIKFGEGGTIWGYERAIELGGEIICVKSKYGDLYKGMEVELADTPAKSLINQKPGEKIHIIKFRHPFSKEDTDHFIRIATDGGDNAWVKETEIIVPQSEVVS